MRITFCLVPVILITITTLFITSTLSAEVYEASTLHNAVARSETVLNLFYQRWEQMESREQYFDTYLKLNWVKDFNINTFNSGSGEYEPVGMTLVRTYSSMTLSFPLTGTYSGKNSIERLQDGAAYIPPKADQDTETRKTLWNPRSLVIGFTATGFHYGLTRKAQIDRGTAGSTTVTDYKYTQFFDDIFAATLLYRPYFNIHGGIIINNQIEPNDDGTMDYTESAQMRKRYFIASNLFSFMDLNTAGIGDRMERFVFGLHINPLVSLLFGDPGPRVPQLTITYRLLRLYNDEEYDAVWVQELPEDPVAGKTEEEKKEASLHTVSFLITRTFAQRAKFSLFIETQKPGRKLIDKRTGETLRFPVTREMYAQADLDYFKQNNIDLLLSLGVSRLWDPAIPVHRESGRDYWIFGGFIGTSFHIPWCGIELKAIKNYSRELRKLTESADKWAFEGSLYIRF